MTTPVRCRRMEARTMNKRKMALWALRNPRARRLIARGVKSRRVRGMAWAAAKRAVRR